MESGKHGKMTYSTINGAMESVQELASDSTTSGIVFDQQDLRRSDPPWVWDGILLSRFWNSGLADLGRFRRSGIWDVVDMLAVHGIDAIIRTHGINKVVEVF